jgi:hypothetical protein
LQVAKCGPVTCLLDVNGVLWFGTDEGGWEREAAGGWTHMRVANGVVLLSRDKDELTQQMSIPDDGSQPDTPGTGEGTGTDSGNEPGGPFGGGDREGPR